MIGVVPPTPLFLCSFFFMRLFSPCRCFLFFSFFFLVPFLLSLYSYLVDPISQNTLHSALIYLFPIRFLFVHVHTTSFHIYPYL
jgi:hypothetical protein